MYKQNLSLTVDPSLSFYIGCTVCFFSFLNTLQPEWMLGRHLCWGRRGSHMTQRRSSGPKQERGSMSRHGTSRECLQPHHDDKSICTVRHRSDRMQDPSGGGPGVSCVCVWRGWEPTNLRSSVVRGDQPSCEDRAWAEWGAAWLRASESRRCRSSGSRLGDCNQEGAAPTSRPTKGGPPVRLSTGL